MGEITQEHFGEWEELTEARILSNAAIYPVGKEEDQQRDTEREQPEWM